MHDMTSVPVFIVQGEKVGLAPMRRDLLETYARWVNNLQVTRTLGIPSLPMTIEREQGWLDRVLTSQEPLFTIYELATGRPIGNTGLHDIDPGSGTATFGILIGETDAWGQGFGTETARLMLSYGFDVLGLHNIDLQVFAHNPAGIRAYERAGFKTIGVRRGAHKVGRERHDIVYMDAVADEIEPSLLHHIMQSGRAE